MCIAFSPCEPSEALTSNDGMAKDAGMRSQDAHRRTYSERITSMPETTPGLWSEHVGQAEA